MQSVASMMFVVPEPGALIGGVYRVVGPLGSGAMGVVLLANDETLDRKVAIKFIRANLLGDGFRARFVEEARAMARVRHPNMLQIYAFGEHNGAPYFVMEFVDGTTLTQWMADNGGPLDLESAVRILGQICDGVAAIHAAHTVHRDLKPSNFIIDAEGNAHVADLGLAVLQEAEGRSREIAGTPAYMAPEVAFPDTSGPSSDPRADVYSLACTAYELLTGRTPFNASGTQAMMFQHAITQPTPPSAHREGLSPLMDAAILKALEKNPVDRTPSVQAFRAALFAAQKNIHEPERLLVAEDNDDFREVLAMALQFAFPNAALDCVADGRAALEAFDRARPSVAIIDLLMPELDGMQLTGLLRARDPEGKVPIIVLTASGGPPEWKRLSAMGADRLLVKPVVFDDVVAVIRHSLKGRAASKPPPLVA